MLASAVRTDVSRTRLGLFLASGCAVVGTVARRTMSGPLLVATGGLFIVTIVLFATARRSIGRCPLRSGGGRLRLGENGPEIPARDVWTWTLKGRTARVYTVHAGWKVRAELDQADAFRALLVGTFGTPRSLTRRGSLRGRVTAAAVAGLGLASAATGIILEIPAFAMLGVPAFVFGLAFLGALSQKITRPPGRHRAGCPASTRLMR